MENLDLNFTAENIQSLDQFRESMNATLGPNWKYMLVTVCAIGFIIIMVILWTIFEQLRQTRKMYKYIREDLAITAPEPGKKYTMCDFNGFTFKTIYMIVLAVIFSIASILRIYMGSRINVVIQLFVMYFPVWKLCKSSGFQASHIKIWSGLTTLFFVWTCIKMGLMTVVGTIFTIFIIAYF